MGSANADLAEATGQPVGVMPRMSAPATAPGRGGGGLAQDEPLDLSIVMPCLNEAGGLEYCIESAQASLVRLGVRGEVVIADNGRS